MERSNITADPLLQFFCIYLLSPRSWTGRAPVSKLVVFQWTRMHDSHSVLSATLLSPPETVDVTTSGLTLQKEVVSAETLVALRKKYESLAC